MPLKQKHRTGHSLLPPFIATLNFLMSSVNNTCKLDFMVVLAIMQLPFISTNNIISSYFSTFIYLKSCVFNVFGIINLIFANINVRLVAIVKELGCSHAARIDSTLQQHYVLFDIRGQTLVQHLYSNRIYMLVARPRAVYVFWVFHHPCRPR